MPKAKKTQSGKYRVVIYDYKDSTGKVHQKSFTADTKREAERLAVQYKNGPSVSDLTVGEAVKNYITAREAILSPSTCRSYKSIYDTHFAGTRFGAVKLSRLDTVHTQIFISDLEDLSPKTIRNIYGLLSASVQMYYPGKILQVTFPARKHPELYTPMTAEVETLIQSIKADHELQVFVMLCAFGPMRRSEACGLSYSDINYKTRTVTVRRARVMDPGGNWVYKDTPKTDSSYRKIIYPDTVIKAIGRGFGYVIDKSTPAALSDRFARARDRAGLPKFRVHDLRHYGASVLHAIGIPDEYIMARGGWKSDYVMKRVYRDTLTDVEKEMNKKAVDYFEKMVT